MNRLVPTLVTALCAAALVFGGRARAGDADEAPLVAHPEQAKDPRALRVAAEDVLETKPLDPAGLRALLLAAARLEEVDLLDDAIERARPALQGCGVDLRAAMGIALLHRARAESPADRARLEEAASLLVGAEGPEGSPARALELAYARHLLGDRPGATKAYERALDGDVDLAELAMKGLASLSGGRDPEVGPVLDDLAIRRPKDGTVLRWRAEVLHRTHGRATAISVLQRSPETLAESPRAAVLLARWLREAERHEEALPIERQAVAKAEGDVQALSGVERLWREARPLTSFDDCRSLDADFRDLLKSAESNAWLTMTWENDLAFRLREVVSTYAWRGEGRTQGLARGAPPDARSLLDRCVALYEHAATLVPRDAFDRPFAERWTYASVCNDAALMRHFWVDVRDIDKAEATYLRAFELTDGAYMDTYDYNLQYLYGFEKPGYEEKWWRLARKASETILKEGPEGSFVPDMAKREAARRDAEALRRLLDERDAAKDGTKK